MTGRGSGIRRTGPPAVRPGRRLASAATALLPGPVGSLEYLVTGTGQPSTVFAHGLGGTIATTRPFGSGVPGRRAFLHFRGYGRSALGGDLQDPAQPPPPWTYQAIGEDLRAVADHQQATRALGVSMGAGALCALLCDTPARFERVVLMLPAIIDRPRNDGSRDRLLRLLALNEAGDVAGIAAHLLDEQPAFYRERPAVRAWVAGHAEALAGAGSRHALEALTHVVPVSDRSRLRDVTAEVLVVGQEGDVAHPSALALELATLFPRARAVVLPAGGALWGHRNRVRALVADFLR